jgi:hypothetical protein
MPGTRDHDPLVIEEFGGWWDRGDAESCPSDHFTIAENVQYIHSGVETRDGIQPYFFTPQPTIKILRAYNYTTQKGDTILALSDEGRIYHITGRTSADVTLVLTVTGMEDFGFVAINGRAYITPFKIYTGAYGENYSLGLGAPNGFLYVYKGDGSLARKAAGLPPSNPGVPLVAAYGTDTGTQEVVDAGKHLIAVVYETDTGYLTALGPEIFAELDFQATKKVLVTKIPVSTPPPSPVVRRHLVSTKAILNYNGDQKGYQFFFIPGGTINDNTTTSWEVAYFDSDLIADASHLIDNFSEIPAGVNLTTYHSRLIIVGEFGTTETLQGLPPGITDNRSIARVSFPGEPESISKIDGLIVAPLDGQALTTAQEFRDVLYLFKHTRTYVYSDNNDEPVTWQEEVVDQAVGAPVHGIATVLDSGGVNTDFLLIVDWSGLMLFNGVFARPELSFKIENFWKLMDRNLFHQLEIVNDSINKKMWITIPGLRRNEILHADYTNGMNAMAIRWSKWKFNADINTILLINTDDLTIGTNGPHVDDISHPAITVIP